MASFNNFRSSSDTINLPPNNTDIMKLILIEDKKAFEKCLIITKILIVLIKNVNIKY